MALKKHRSENGSKFSVILRRDIEISHLSIAARAYGLWLRQGRPVGRDVANWLEAESELKRATAFDDEDMYKATRVDLERSDLTPAGLISTFS